MLADLVAAGRLAAYLAGPAAAMPDSTQATVRSVLRRVVRNAAPGQAAARIGYTPVAPPYTPAECARFVRLARTQPTAAKRRSLSALVALGLGAGLDGGDQKAITPADIARVELGEGISGLAVSVHGSRPRTVIMREAYETLLIEALELHRQAGRGEHTPLYGRDPDRINVTGRVTSFAVTALGPGVEINAARLRTTWLVAAMCAPIPVKVLLAAAGLHSARTFADLIGYCPDPDPAETARLTRTLAQVPSALPADGQVRS